MLYVFLGSDVVSAKQEARKRAEGEVLLFGEGGESFDTVPAHLGASGLFSETLTLLLDRPSETDEGKNLLAEYAKQLCDCAHIVFVFETKLDAKTKKLFPQKAVFEAFELQTPAEQPRPNVFAFTDTVLKKDKKGAWLGYQKLLRAGISAEEVHGALSWAVRSTLIAAKTKDAAEAGLKPFVYTKSKRVAEKLGVEHFEELSRNLVSTYHQARAGEGELSLGLEKFLLEKI